MSAYYNEYDKNAAAWLRELIKDGQIAPGEVDERSITEVTAGDIRGFTQHHFFAGIGGWSYALRLAGWHDARPVVTASLPCQPFSCAGKQRGKSDERHLLPHFIELVKQCNFETIFGEQVPGAIRHGWLDDLYAEMESENYAVGAVVLTAAGAGAPHIRQRLYWVADAINEQREPKPHQRPASVLGAAIQPEEPVSGFGGMGAASGGVGNSSGAGLQGRTRAECPDQLPPWASSLVDWLYCRDNKYRPVKPGIKPLVDGIAEKLVRSRDSGAPLNADHTQEARVMRLKGYGNAICPQTAAQFISAFMAAA